MTIKVGGVSGGFVSNNSSASILVAIGQTADIVIPCPTGKRLRLTQLQAQVATLTTDISVTAGARVVLTNIRVSGGSSGPVNATGQINIGGNQPNQPPILGKINEDITLSFALATLQAFLYSSEESES